MHDCDACIGVRLLACFLPPNCKFDKPSLFNCLDADFFFFFFYFLLMFTFGGFRSGSFGVTAWRWVTWYEEHGMASHRSYQGFIGSARSCDIGWAWLDRRRICDQEAFCVYPRFLLACLVFEMDGERNDILALDGHLMVGHGYWLREGGGKWDREMWRREWDVYLLSSACTHCIAGDERPMHGSKPSISGVLHSEYRHLLPFISCLCCFPSILRIWTSNRQRPARIRRSMSKYWVTLRFL